MSRITLTLEYPWESIRSFRERYIRTVEGPKIDVLSLKKAELNSNKITVNSRVVSFDHDLLKSEIGSKSIIFFHGVNDNGADGFVKNIRSEDEEIDIYYYDSNPTIGLKGYSNGDIKIPTFGMEYEELFNILEESGVINRVSVFSFIILNKGAFYELSGDKRRTMDEVLEIMAIQLKNAEK